MLRSAARRLIERLLLGFCYFIISIFTLLDVTSREKSVVILLPALRKEEVVDLDWAIVTLRHTAAFLSCRFCVFDPKNKTQHGLRIVRHLSRLSGFRVGYRVNMSNEMATVLVGLVHFHDSPFVKECLFFGGKSVGPSEIKRCDACRYC
jgi:hypothetical protein